MDAGQDRSRGARGDGDGGLHGSDDALVRPQTRRELRAAREAAVREASDREAALRGSAPQEAVAEPPKAAVEPLTRRALRRAATAAAPALPSLAPRVAAPPMKRSRNRAPVIAPDPMPPGAPTILIVCTGNICRSPLAEVLLRAALDPLGVHVHSAGTHALVGSGMPEEARLVARARHARSADVAAHRARHLREPMVIESDLVLTMTQEQRGYTVQLVPSRLHRIFPVREFARAARHLPDAEILRLAETGGDDPRTRLGAVIMAVDGRRGALDAADDVLDPYRQGMRAYETSAAQLDPALAEVVRVVRVSLDGASRA